MSTLETRSIKQKVINNVTQPLYIGGIDPLGSDSKLTVNSDGSVTAATQASGDATTKIATTAFATNQDLGVGQTWQDLTSSRALGVTYTNTTGKPIMVAVVGSTNVGAFPYITVGTITTWGSYNATIAQPLYVTAIVPSGTTYSADFTAGAKFLAKWNELR